MRTPPDVLVYARPFCPYCVAAKALLKEKGVTFREIDITGDDEQRDQMISRSGRTTVPQIFIGERHVGGYDELAALDDQGELDALLGLQE